MSDKIVLVANTSWYLYNFRFNLIKELINKAYREGANIPYTQNTPYINTIPPEAEIKSNGDQNIERRIRSLIRWNAAAMVVRANKKFPELDYKPVIIGNI